MNEVKPSVKLDERTPYPKGQGRRHQPFWWQKQEDDLAVVTDEAYNTTLGIVAISMQYPTANQKKAGILGTVTLETISGWDYGITIWESKTCKGDIMLMMNGRQGTNANGEKEFFRDRKINDATTAQILRCVYKHLRPIKKQE